MLGVSYGGWLTAMAMLEPHPALKAVSPQASPADMFLGDDFHHNGAFRLSYGFEYAAEMETSKENSLFPFDLYDTYEWYLRLGPLVERRTSATSTGKIPTWNDFVAHPNYDAFWQKQAMAPYLDPGHGPDAQRRRLVGPGGFLRAAEDLRDARAPRPGRAELLRGRARGTTAAGCGRGGDRLGRIEFGADTGEIFPGEDPGAVVRLLSQGQGRLATSGKR